ncbi:TPA: hypothetical protein ACJEU7_002195 [Acinetobacter baumannii]|uniref:hypothetical protein n=1 Tax=Acinetobacter baumannii TaxID=470 RepID=UPI00224FF76A|nr:hypothetical protein [Acinetobacter baumannii]MCX3035216.1 hypothetical protein [Acinetobacter baumannii]
MNKPLDEQDVIKINSRLGITTLVEQHIHQSYLNEFDYVQYSKTQLVLNKNLLENDLNGSATPRSLAIETINTNLDFLASHIEKTYMEGKPDVDSHSFLSKQAEDLGLISSKSLNSSPNDAHTKDVFLLKEASMKTLGRLVVIKHHQFTNQEHPEAKNEQGLKLSQ